MSVHSGHWCIGPAYCHGTPPHRTTKGVFDRGCWTCCGANNQFEERCAKPPLAKRKLSEHEVAAKCAKSLWAERKFTDFELVCKDTTIACHRAVLSAASPVFDKMLESAFVEGVSRKAEIPEEGEDVEAMLKFVYTGELSVQSHAALLLLADKYELTDLFDTVLSVIVEETTPKTVASNLRALRSLSRLEKVKETWVALLAAVKTQDDLLEAVASAL
mmetsp:Transcript_1748/g.3747  ORF Transcript_1748/g.3747 Transcript_1748/m.3747 type:complete len:217 (-) Transcript_1748:366-1016(-)